MTGQASWSEVTLLPTANAVEAQAVDTFGNGSDVLAESATLVLDVPVVDFASPDQDLVVGEGTLDVIISVTDQDSGTGIDAAVVTLLIDGADSGVAANNEGDGIYTFANVPLTEDTQVGLQAVASFAGQEGASGIRLVTWKTTQPTVAITSPADGAVFNLASAECLGSGEACNTSISASVGNAEPGSAVSILVSCVGADSELEGTWSGGELVFGGVDLAHGGACTLTPMVTDAASQTVTGDVVTVTVDRVAPVVEAFLKPASAQLINFDDVQGATPGMQHPLTVRISGVEAGQVLSVTMDWVDNVTQAVMSEVFQHTVATTTGDGAFYSANIAEPVGSGVVTYGTASDGFEGDVTLTATVLDASLNGASGNTVVFVKPVAPSVRITAPSYVSGEACTPGSCQTGLCNQGTCWTAWGLLSSRQVLVALTGLLTTEANLRVCSDHASLAAAGTPCASSGYYEVALVDAPADGSHFVVFAEDDLPEGFQTIIAESRAEADGDWLASLEEPVVGERSRQLYVDVTAPEVNTIITPSDTQPPFGVLNSAEQALPGGIYSIRVETSEDGQADVFLQGAKVSTVDVDSGVAVFNLDLDEGPNELYVRVKDFASNVSVASTSPELVTLDVVVDTVLPSALFVSPSTSPLVGGDVLDVVISSNEDGSQVTLFDGGLSVGTLEVTDGQVVFDHATHGVLGEGSHTLTATVVDPNGNENSAATSPATISVDTLPPFGAIVAPSNGESLTDGDDADAAPGYQIAVDFSTADGAEDWTLSIAYGCDDTYANCGVASEVAAGAVTNPGAGEPSELVDVSVKSTPAYASIILETRDAVGNVATTSVGVTFSLTCIISITDLIEGTWYNGAFCDGGAPCANANITLTGEFVGACGGVDELRLVDGETVLGTDLDVGDNVGVFDITINDGTTVAFELKGYGGGLEVVSSGAAVRKVDLSPPTVDFVAADVAGFITPAADSTAVYNAGHDASGALAGFQGHARVTITDTNANGGSITALTATTDGITVDLLPSNVTLPSSITSDSPVSRSFLDLSYTDQATTTVTVTASDAAGNSATSSFDATVDAVAPDAVALSAIAAIDVNPRLPAVTLNWSAPGDPGPGGSVAAAAYDIRYSRNAIGNEAGWASACPISGANGLLNSAAFPTPGTPGAAETYTASGPDPRDESALVGGQPCKLASSLPLDGGSGQAYHFAIRAADAAGNWSPVSASVSTTDLVYQRTRIRFTDAFIDATSLAPAFFRDLITVDLTMTGDMDDDTVGDFAVGHFVPDILCWFRGGSLGTDYDVDDLTGPSHNCIKGAASAVPGASQIGSYIDKLGDVNGDGFMDFGASGKVGSPAKGFIAVFLGSPFAGPDLTAPDVLILGADGLNGPPYFNWCGAGDFTGDGLGDIAVGEPSVDRVQVIPGDTDWVFGQGGSGGQVVIDVDVAGDLVAASAITLHADFGSAAQFGQQCRAAGDILPTPGGGAAADELLVLQSENDARLFLIAGRAETPGANDVVTFSENPAIAPTAGDLESTRIRQDLVGGDTAVDGWASSFDGTDDLTGDGIPDVMVTHGNRSLHNDPFGEGMAIWIFDGAAAAANVGEKAFRVTVQGGLNGKSWTGVNGTVLQADISNFFRGVRVVGNFDGWMLDGVATPDVWIADNTKATVEVRANHEDDGGASVLGEFPYSDAYLVNPDPALSGGGTTIGLNMDGGTDLTGDGLPDIILGTQKGEVLLIH